MQTGLHKNKRKIASAVGAIVLALAIILTGTYAWQSISQKAINETDVHINPGGRLHDDFDGRNKDVYVENFTDPENGGVPIFIRARLDEYMEIGPTAGKKNKTLEEAEGTKPLIAGADINNPDTWATHIPAASSELCENGDEDTFHKYWGWDLGGETAFMPTFNKNKDSLKADINGTYAGKDGDPDQGERYDDYVEYAVGGTKEDMAVYDADINDTDEGDSAVEGVNIDTVKEEHTVKSTQNAAVITMAEWKELGSPIGKYWVYDTDGWAYWAEGLLPGEATGLLLNGINLNREPDQNCYYSISAVGQFVTRGDWGDPESKTGFYADDAGAPPTADALYLLKQAADLLPKVTGITFTEGENVYVKPGESITLHANVKVVNGTDDPAEKAVSWGMQPAAEENVFKDGVFTPTEAMTGQKYQVTATSTYNTSFSATANVFVYPSEAVSVDKGKDGKMYVNYGDNTFKEILADGTLGKFICGGKDAIVGNADDIGVTSDSAQVVIINPADATYGSKFIGEEYDYGYWAAGPDGKLGTADDIKVWGHDWPNHIDTNQPVIADAVTVTAVGNKNSIKPGGTLQFSASVTLNGNPIERQNVSWSVSGAAKAGTTIDSSGLLTVAANETAQLTVRATSQAAHGVWGESVITVIPDGMAGVDVIEPNSSHVATIDGIEWYVLAKDGNKALLWSKEMIPGWGSKVFGSNNQWNGSAAQTWLNSDFINSLTTIKNSVVVTTLNTRSQYNASTWVETTDKVFLLSEADLFGQHNGSATSETKDYTYKGTKLITNAELLKCSSSITSYSWLRSPRDNTGYVAMLNCAGSIGNNGYSPTGGVRPALWVTYK